mgnify:CR=1 FL=1
MSTEDEVPQASDHFSAALNCLLHGDAELVLEVWSHRSDITTMNPHGGWEQGNLAGP